MIVRRPSLLRCAAASLPLPVWSRYATSFGPSTRKLSDPFGDTLIRESAVADAVKKICWRSMNSRKAGSMRENIFDIRVPQELIEGDRDLVSNRAQDHIPPPDKASPVPP